MTSPQPKKTPKKKKAAPKKVASKRAASPKTPGKKDPPGKAAVKKAIGKRLLVARPLANQTIAGVRYEVKFFGGTGEIDLAGENIDVTLTSNDNFDVSQSIGSQVTIVGGFTGGGGAHIDVTVTENGSQIGAGSFSGNTFNSAIKYIVK